MTAIGASVGNTSDSSVSEYILVDCVDYGYFPHLSNLRNEISRRDKEAESERLSRSRAQAIQITKRARAAGEQLLALRESELKRITEEYERRRELYQQGLLSRTEVIQAEHAVAQAKQRVEDDKRLLAETDAALTKFPLKDSLQSK